MPLSLEDLMDTEFASWGTAEEPLKAGDTIIGELVSLRVVQGDYKPYPVIEILDNDKKGWRVHAFHTVLKNELANQKPSVGDRIGIRYKGKSDRVVKGMQPPELYDVRVERAAGNPAAEAISWETMAADAEEEMEDFSPEAEEA